MRKPSTEIGKTLLAMPPAKPSSRTRTFTGCWTCRARKVKCDERRPACTPCTRVGRECSGYGPRLLWLSEAEPKGDQQITHNRRALRTDLTWHGYPTLSSDLVDSLIDELDDDSLPSEVFRSHKCYSPFSVLAPKAHQSEKALAQEVELSSQTKHPPIMEPHTEAMDIAEVELCSPVIETALVQLPGSRQSTYQEKMLFSHYTSHVAQIMMPFDDARNPWLCEYPAAAVSPCASNEQQALYHALLAHAAFNMAHLLDKDSANDALATRHYDQAIAHVHSSFSSEAKDFGTLQAAIMTLMFGEIYSGRSNQWRTHLKGAWALLKDCKQEEPWNSSEFAWSTSQSLCIIQTISGTTLTAAARRASKYSESQLIHSITIRPTFGFTVGATKMLLEVISEITELSHSVQDGGAIDLPAIVTLCRRLEDCKNLCHKGTAWVQGDLLPERQLSTPYQILVVQCHLQAFIAATYIYMHQVLFSATPAKSKQYVHEVFDNVSAFLMQKGGNLTVWPAFIAAVEACDDVDMASAQVWLEEAQQVGMGSRKQVDMVIKEVWQRRRTLADATGLELDQCFVDWREVMHEMDLDILLV